MCDRRLPSFTNKLRFNLKKMSEQAEDWNEWELVDIQKTPKISPLNERENDSPELLPPITIGHLPPTQKENKPILDLLDSSVIYLDEDAKQSRLLDPSLDYSSSSWTCPTCSTIHPNEFRFCPNCGGNNNQQPPNINYQDPLLSCEGVISCGQTFKPREIKEFGWELKNLSKCQLNLVCVLEHVGGEKLELRHENVYHFNISQNESIYILGQLVAPNRSKQYTSFYALKCKQTGRVVSPLLEINIIVKSQFGKKKENQIQQIMDMGFTDRSKVVQLLRTNQWNVQNTINQLILSDSSSS